MFSHICVGTNDLEKSRGFYDAVIGTMGGGPGIEYVPGRLLYEHGGGRLLVVRPVDGKQATHANGGTIGFGLGSPEAVDAWHAAGVANGGTTCEDPPGIRTMGEMVLYLAYLRDPVGNKLCAMHTIAA